MTRVSRAHSLCGRAAVAAFLFAASSAASARSALTANATPEAIACGASNLASLSSRIYVAPGGENSASCGSSPANACLTIRQGLSRCAPPGCGVLVAWGQYHLTESLQLRNGVNLYGGCLPVGQADPGYRSFLYAPAGGWPVAEGSLVKGVTLENFKLFGSGGGNYPSGASVAVQVFGGSGSYGITINNSVIFAGSGGAGTSGAPNPAMQGANYPSKNLGICGAGGTADPHSVGLFSRKTWSWLATEGGAGGDGGPGAAKGGAAGGNPGMMGGASFGILALWSSIDLNNTVIVGDSGGAGGTGATGGVYGRNGFGGGGGGGAAGNGGPAIGVALASAIVSGDKVYYYSGFGGQAGNGGWGGAWCTSAQSSATSAPQGAAGSNGVAANTFDLPFQ
jgi:hypothetical protein